MEIPSPNSRREIVFDYEAFKTKIDPSKPLHHHATRRALDSHGLLYEVTFCLEGISREGGWVLRFEASECLDPLSKEFREKHPRQGNVYSAIPETTRELYSQLIDKFAKPLGSTEGRWEWL